MGTGRDVAQFLSDNLGSDFVGLYDASKKEEQRQEGLKESAINGFNSMMARINKVEENNKQEYFD